MSLKTFDKKNTQLAPKQEICIQPLWSNICQKALEIWGRMAYMGLSLSGGIPPVSLENLQFQ